MRGYVARAGNRMRGLVVGVSIAALCGLAPGRLQADSRLMYDTGGGGIHDQYLAHCQAAWMEDRMTEALAACDRAIGTRPAFMAAHLKRGLILMFMGQNDAAVDAFTRVIAAHPDWANTYYFRGLAQLYLHRPNEAIDDFNRSASTRGILSDLYANVLAVRSLAWEMLGNVDPAIADLDHATKALRNIPDYTYVMLNERCYTATIAGLLDSAEDSCDGSLALRSDSDNEYTYASRGLLDLKIANWDRAIADYTKVLYYRPHLTMAFYGRSVAERAKGDVVAADADAAQAIKGEPHVAEIMSRLGVKIALVTKPK